MPSKMQRRARIEAAGHAPVRRVAIEALRREPDAEELLRRHAAEPPQAARLSGEAVVVLAGRALPVLGAVAPTHLDVAACRVHRRHPVEAVAAHVHQPAAVVQVGAQTVEHLDRVVLGVRGRQHDLVGRQGRRAFEVQILVGDEVDLELLRVEPVDEVGVGHELPRIVRGDLRPHVGDRPQARRVADAAAVAVARVEAERPERAGPGAGVGEVAEGRDQQRNPRRRRPPLLRADEERHVVLARAVAQPGRVDAASACRARRNSKPTSQRASSMSSSWK